MSNDDSRISRRRAIKAVARASPASSMRTNRCSSASTTCRASIAMGKWSNSRRREASTSRCRYIPSNSTPTVTRERFSCRGEAFNAQSRFDIVRIMSFPRSNVYARRYLSPLHGHPSRRSYKGDLPSVPTGGAEHGTTPELWRIRRDSR